MFFGKQLSFKKNNIKNKINVPDPQCKCESVAATSIAVTSLLIFCTRYADAVIDGAFKAKSVVNNNLTHIYFYVRLWSGICSWHCVIFFLSFFSLNISHGFCFVNLNCWQISLLLFVVSWFHVVVLLVQNSSANKNVK